MSGGVLSGKALILRVPTYPEGAPRWRRAEKVKVDVVVDESGKVISAQAKSGPPSLRDAAIEAAKRARFSPTKLSGAAVKIFRGINYKFILPLILWCCAESRAKPPNQTRTRVLARL